MDAIKKLKQQMDHRKMEKHHYECVCTWLCMPRPQS